MQDRSTLFKILLLISILILLGLGYFAYQTFSVNRSMENYTQNYINTALKNNDNDKLLKISSDQQVFHDLKAQKQVVIRFKTDNQGSGKVAYFPATIGSKSKMYGVTLTIHSWLKHQYTLKQVSDLKDQKN